MIDSGAQVLFLQAHLPALPPGFSFVSRRTGVQMVYAADPPPAPHVLDIVPLGRGDAPDMLSLATLTAPGPFAARTSEIGRFWGVRRQNRLIAMAGERLRVGKWTEVSGICTHPDHRGQGFAAALTAHVIREMLARGEQPFLHSYADNAGAIQLYELLGFRFSRMMEAVALKRL
jgi:predicted GNAT family acetyltransferase